MKPTISTLVAASALALLSACGGSDGGGATSQPVGPEGLSITSSNQAAVTQATVAGGLSVSNVETATNAGGAAAQPGSVKASAHSLAAVVRRVLAAGPQRRAAIESAAAARPLAVSSDIAPCGVSGTLTTTFNDVDGNGQISAGDILTIHFNQCRDSATSLYNGSAVITMATVPTAEQITGTADFQNLSAVEGGLTSTVDGTLNISETDSDTASNVTLTVGGNGLTETMASSTYNDVVMLDSGVRITVDEVFAAHRSQLTFDGLLQAQSVPGGAVTLTTKSPFVLNDGDAFPSAGVLQVKGVHGTLLITVLNATTVQVQLDANDDGVNESTASTPWTSLIPQ
ncbi:hypothetical protein [Scleromatobacter humisilvae]|uniref:EF-hand domain-containing protein n=1 Tax=Scleromatobacter humisilvae TaxID=2897159 RepID=A0A9X1YL85_9BURK|nr:hypothetical protein [Scleromatobacter humisilvae]MCK9687792.1 hypothetical protein [Scleromatobacter humisilvae]